jgi:hypothetical protein
LSSKTKDLDEKFVEVLGSMELDTTGGLVEILSRQGKSISLGGNHLADLRAFLEYLQLIIGPWKDFASDWVARCSTDSDGVYSRILAGSVCKSHFLDLQWTGFFLARCSKC